MNVLKKMSLLLFLFVMVSNVAFAQSSVPELSDEQKEEIQKNMKSFVESLEMTEEQKTDFIAIYKKYGHQLLELKDSDSSKFRKYRKAKSINKSRNKEMKKLLSKEQYKLYAEKQKEIQKKMKESHSK